MVAQLATHQRVLRGDYEMFPSAAPIYFMEPTGVPFADTRKFKPMRSQLPSISLFSGAGGMDIGLEAAGFAKALCVEIDPDCRATLRHNRPRWIVPGDEEGGTGDITKAEPEDLLEKLGVSKGEVGVVSGGAPCQPFSNMGKKLGSRDPNNGDLFQHFARIVDGTLPHFFIFENVSGLSQDRHSDVLEYMRERFSRTGYKLSSAIFNAADYGVAQKRKRFILLGARDVDPILPMPTHSASAGTLLDFVNALEPRPNMRLPRWRTVDDTLSGLSEERLTRSDNIGMRHAEYMIERMKLVRPGKNFKSLPMSERPECWKSGKHQGHDTFGRIVGSEPSPTIRTAGYNPTKGRYIHPTEHRGLTTAEMAALQGFPQTWEFKTASGKPSIVSIGRQIGNAVPPPLAKHLGLAMRLATSI